MSDEQNEINIPTETEETFSFFEVLEGRTYPEDEVTVSMDEAAAYDLGKLQRDMDEAKEPTDLEIKEFQERADNLQKRIEDSKFTFHLKGVPDDLIADIKEVADERFHDKKINRKNAQGHIERILPEGENANYMRFFSAVMMSLHVTSIQEHRTGKVMTAPSADEIAYFYDKAPGAAKERLSQAIAALRVASAQYEAQLDEGFFPKP